MLLASYNTQGTVVAHTVYSLSIAVPSTGQIEVVISIGGPPTDYPIVDYGLTASGTDLGVLFGRVAGKSQSRTLISGLTPNSSTTVYTTITNTVGGYNLNIAIYEAGTPPQIARFPTSNLFARYEAKYETASVGSNLTSVTDASGSGHNAIPPSGKNGPVLTNSIVNGQPAYGFTGVEQAIASFNTVSSCTISIVAAATTATSRTWPLTLNTAGQSSTTVYGLDVGATSGEWGVFLRTGASWQPATSFIDPTEWAVITLDYDGATVGWYINGTLVGSQAMTGSIAVGEVSLGLFVSQGFKGNIALASVWASSLGAIGRANLHSYVQDTYGIAVSDYGQF